MEEVEEGGTMDEEPDYLTSESQVLPLHERLARRPVTAEVSAASDWAPVLPTDRARRPAHRRPAPAPRQDDRALVAAGIGIVGALVGMFVMLATGYGAT